jgi:serine O-acetyltransferase
MKPSFRRLRMTVGAFRVVPHIIVMLLMKDRALVEADLARGAEMYGLRMPRSSLDFVILFIASMTFLPEFRNVFYLRVGIMSHLFSWMCPRLSSLQIVSPKIGPGLFIQHGIATLVSAERIGANCQINQHVVVGYTNATDRPTIGNNVRILAGAKVVGKITIGDNSTIGMNSVVMSDVEPGVTVLGVPARVIWRNATQAKSQSVAESIDFKERVFGLH